MDPPLLLSIVIPIYNEQDAIPFLINKLKDLLNTRWCSRSGLVNDGVPTRH
jgi:hypothetical protein